MKEPAVGHAKEGPAEAFAKEMDWQLAPNLALASSITTVIDNLLSMH
jgi:hypothetical protein